MKVSELLNYTSHRNWELPKKKWSFYQEWNKVIFLHWEIEEELLEKLVPKKLNLDTFNGKAWISLVSFTMEKIRPRLLPSFPPISNFLEVNLRTYVTYNNKPGVYFLNIEAEKWLSSYIAKKISGLPYQKSNLKHNLKTKRFIGNFKPKGYNLDILYQIENSKIEKTPLDIFLTERYCLYLEEKNRLIRYEIHHLPWEIKQITFTNLTTNYHLKDIELSSYPNLAHYSNGIQVVAWNKEII